MMLKSWSIENFKPIVNSGELKLAPVTVLAGRNSSGKSSLLQSILMIRQTLSSKLVDRPLLPSGLDVQLGTFEDILNVNSDSRTLTVGFELDFATEQMPSSRLRDLFPENRTSITSVRAIAVFNSASSNGTSSSAIEASKVVVERVILEIKAEQYSFVEIEVDHNTFGIEKKVSGFEIQFNMDMLNESQLIDFLQKVKSDYLRFVPYSGGQPNYIGIFKHQKEETQGPALVTLSHFLPNHLVRKFKEEERRQLQERRAIRRVIRSLLIHPDDATIETRIQQYSDYLDPEAPIPSEMRETVQKFCKDQNISENFSGKTLLELIVWSRSLIKPGVATRRDPLKTENEISKIIAQIVLKKELENHEDAEGLEVSVNDIKVENLNRAVAEITRFFTSQIRYLGPLRADPQASQKFSPSSELDDVGAKGEYAAAVYDANQNARIDWFNPISQRIEQDTLKFALNSWVSHLDVANRIETKEAGQSGFSWRVVSKKGQPALPLSAVGVGVSQVLPILVMGLLTPSDTLLIVEQPELHLHPSIQARLGDFFVGLSKCKKQCLIETHSENLVNQLRYHIVQAGGMDKSDCTIYFVDQGKQGGAKFEPIEISPQGNILNWPEGFFDETMLQEDRITAASIKKRATKAKNA